uniref:Uncharacterized protein n=1 Tax=Vitis vinifera TaxID=29760 RepID=F6HMD3_VITVI
MNLTPHLLRVYIKSIFSRINFFMIVLDAQFGCEKMEEKQTKFRDLTR